MLWSKIYFIRNSFWKFYEMRSERGDFNWCRFWSSLVWICTLMLWLYLSPARQFYSDWLWPYCVYLKSTQYKKLEPNSLRFTYQNLKSCKSHEKMKQRTSDSCFQFFINKSSILMFFVLFFHVVCKISNSNMLTAKPLAKASFTELTLHQLFSTLLLQWVTYLHVKGKVGY